MMSKLGSIGFLFVALVLLSACQREEKFPVEPAISFVSFEKIDDGSAVDNKGKLTIHFQDGDGDVGLNETDTMPPFNRDSIYHYNFFINYYEKQNGDYVLVELPLTNNARIPRLSNSVPESIEGDVSIELYINNFLSPYDTIRFACYIVDRALHHSNTITTPDIVVKKH